MVSFDLAAVIGTINHESMGTPTSHPCWLSSDARAIQEAIRSGVPEAVERLLNGMPENAQAVTQLTTTYGGASCGRADKDGLLSGTYPVLHVALGGNISMLRVILDAMMKLLSPSQVRYYLRIDRDLFETSARARFGGGGGCGSVVAVHQDRGLKAIEAELCIDIAQAEGSCSYSQCAVRFLV